MRGGNKSDCVCMMGRARLLHGEVTKNDIADIISRWTAILVGKLFTSEHDKLLHLQTKMSSNLKMKDHAKSRCMRRIDTVPKLPHQEATDDDTIPCWLGVLVSRTN